MCVCVVQQQAAMLTSPVEGSPLSYPHMMPLATHMSQLHLHQSVSNNA